MKRRRQLPKEVAFHDLPATAFPFTISAFRTDTDQEVWSLTVHEAPYVIEIPPLAKQYGEVYIQVKFASGEVVVQR